MLKKFLAALASVTLALGLAATTGALASSATVVDDHSGECITSTDHFDAVAEVSHQEYQYDQVIPAVDPTFHLEYRYSKTTTTYTVEHKQIKGWYFDNTQSGTTTVGGHVFAGKWVPGDADTYYQVPDDIVNAAGVNPYAVAQTGNVPLSAYGYTGSPNPSPAYKITGIELTTTPPVGSLYVTLNNVTLYYTGSGDGSPTLADAIYVQVAPGNGWVQYGSSKSVSDFNGSDEKTVYYWSGHTPTDVLTDDNWTIDTQVVVGDEWTLIHERKVVTTEAVDAYDVNHYGTCPSDPCVSQSSAWFTEAGDVAPTQQPGGLLFSGPNVPAVDYLHYVSGNLEGVVGSSYTITSAGGYHAALVYEIWRTGVVGTGFATISIEPYNNGWAPGQTGTFTVTNLTKVWTSKIANPGLGSQANPATIDQMSAIYPANALIAQGIHLGSNSIDGQFTTVSQVTGCGSISFVDPPTISCDRNVDGSNMYLPEIEGVLWSVNGGTPTPGPVVVPLSLTNVTIDSSPASAAYQFGSGQTHWVFEADDNGICQIPTLADFPTNATQTNQTCDGATTLDGTITVGDVEGVAFFSPFVDYFLDGSLTPMATQTVTVKPGVHTVTAAPHDPDDTLDGDTSWEFTIKGAGTVCTDLTTLAFTGSSSPAPWVALGALMLSSGLALIVIRSRRQEWTDAE